MKFKIRSVFLTIFWALSILIILKDLSTPLFDPDLWWHLAAGRELFQGHQFLRTDVFSHTMGGAAWINFEWLSQLILFGLWKGFSVSGLYFWKIGMGLLVFSLYTLTLRKAGARGPILLILAWMGYGVFRVRLIERPELFSLCLISVFIWGVLHLRDNPPKKPLFVYGIFSLLMLIWVNLHGGFVYGIGIVALFLAGAYWAGKRGVFTSFVFRLLALLVGMSLLNPYGAKIARVFFEHGRQFSAGPALIQEWGSVSILNTPSFWLVFLLAVVFIFISLLKREKEARLWIPLVVVFSVWGAVFFRNAALLPFVALPFVAERIQAWSWDQSPPMFSKRGIAVWGLAVVILFLNLPVLGRASVASPVRWNKFPVKACEFIEKNKVTGRMFNDYDHGGYIGWKLGPERKVFMDGRYLFYPLLQSYVSMALRLQSDIRLNMWPAFFEKHDVDYAVVKDPQFFLEGQAGSPFSVSSLLDYMFPESNWALVYWDDVAMVFLKRTPKFMPLISQGEYRVLRPYQAPLLGKELGVKRIDLERLQSEIARHEKEVPESRARQQWEKIILGAD